MRNLEKSYVNELPVLQFGREHLAWERGRFGFVVACQTGRVG